VIRQPSLIQQVYKRHLEIWNKQCAHQNKTQLKAKLVPLVSNGSARFELSLIGINWSYSNKRLVGAFAAFVDQFRPPNVKLRESRGTTSIRDKLRFLSALRLLESLKSPSKAYELTEAILGKPLYSTDIDWYRARQKGRATMKQLFTPFFDFSGYKVRFPPVK